MILDRLGRRETRATLESPTTTLSNPAGWLLESLGALPTNAGVRVSEHTAMKFEVWWACVRAIADTLATPPLILYERLPGGGKQHATNMPQYALCHDAPNAETTSQYWRQTMQSHVCNWGNGYSEIEFNGAGEPIGLHQLLPGRTRAARVIVENPATGARAPQRVVICQVAPGTGTNGGSEVVLPAENVLHIPGLGYDGVSGYPVVRMARQSLGHAIAIEEFGARFFGSGARLSGYISYPNSLSPEAKDRIRSKLEIEHQGLTQAHRLAILDEGMKWEQTSVPPDDAQFLQSSTASVPRICRWHRVPPHMVADLSRGTFCLPAGTDVLTTDGPRLVEAVRAGDQVWSRDPFGRWVRASVLRSECSGVDEILRLRTSNRTLRANARHRVLVRRRHAAPRLGQGGYQCGVWRDEYVPVGDVRVGDVLVVLDGGVPAGSNICPTRNASVGFMEFCGLLLGDGNVTHAGVEIARARTAQYMDHYRDVMRSEFCRYDGGNWRSRSSAATAEQLAPITLVEGDRRTRFASVLAVRELTFLGFSGTAHTKSVPPWVFGMDEGLRLAFLRGFLDADGSVDKMGRISMSSCNRQLLTGIRHLCMMSGVPVTNLRCQRGTTTLPNGRRAEFAQWNFTCSDPGANRRIGSHDPRYVARLAAGKPFGRKARAYPAFGGSGPALTGASLSKVTAITREPEERVYDLEVEGTHNFVADGVIVHNSNIEVQSIEFIRFAMLHWFVAWEQWLNKSLLTLAQRQRYFFEFLVEGFLRGSLMERYQAYAVGRQWGWLCADDVRELENMNPLPNGAGRMYLVPMNMVPADQAANVGQPPEKPPKPGGSPDDQGGGGSPAEASLPAWTSPVAGSAEARAALAAREPRLLAAAGIASPSPLAVAAGGVVDPKLDDALRDVNRSMARAAKKRRQLRSAELRNRHRKAMLPMFHRAAQDVVRQEVQALRSVIKRAKRSRRDDGGAAGSDAPGPMRLAEFDRGMEEFYATFGETIRRAFQPVVATLAGVVQPVIYGDELGLADEPAGAGADELAGAFAAGFAERHAGSAMGQLRAVVRKSEAEDGDTEDAIDTRLGQWLDGGDGNAVPWADKIASVESVRALSSVSKSSYAAAGVVTLVWMAGGESCPLCDTLVGETCEIESNFRDDGEEVTPDEESDSAPLKVRGGGLPFAPLHGGCDCTVSAA